MTLTHTETLDREMLQNNLMPTLKAALSIYQLSITLLDIEPFIWRRYRSRVRSGYAAFTTQFRLQWGGPTAIFISSEKDGRVWGDPRNDEFGEFNIIDESRTTLNKALKSEGASMVYVYDFGENCRHEVVLEKILSVEGATSRPVCLGRE